MEQLFKAQKLSRPLTRTLRERPPSAGPCPLHMAPPRAKALERAAWRQGLGALALVTLTECLAPTRPPESCGSPVADASGRGGHHSWPHSSKSIRVFSVIHQR